MGKTAELDRQQQFGNQNSPCYGDRRHHAPGPPADSPKATHIFPFFRHAERSVEGGQATRPRRGRGKHRREFLDRLNQFCLSVLVRTLNQLQKFATIRIAHRRACAGLAPDRPERTLRRRKKEKTMKYRSVERALEQAGSVCRAASTPSVARHAISRTLYTTVLRPRAVGLRFAQRI